MTERGREAERELFEALAGGESIDFREDREAHPASYAADGTCTGACPVSPADTPDTFVDEATAAVEEWRARNEPLDRQTFDTIRARFAREPGRPAVPQNGDGAAAVHFREVDGDELGSWVADADTALVECDEAVRFADLHAVPLEDGVAPLVVAMGGLYSEAARAAHAHFHALERVRERLDGAGAVLTDGGGASDTAHLTDGQLEAAVEKASPPTFGELVAVLEESDVVDVNPPEAVEHAIANDRLVEDGGESFTHYTVAGDETAESQDTAEIEGRGAGSSAADPQGESGENPAADTAETGDGGLTVKRPPEIETSVFPADLRKEDRWHTWAATDDGRKVPRAPYANPDWPDKFVSAQDPDTWTDFQTAREWADKLDGFGLAFNIRDREEHPEEEYVLVDYDDARDPETGEIHPTVREHIDRAGSYADVSTSGTGVHIFCRGELPEGVKAVEAPLPDAEGFDGAEIEVYDSARFTAMTGDHVAGTPPRTADCQAFLEELTEEYATVTQGTPDEMLEEPEKSADELAEIETTTDVQDVLDAIQHLGPGDVSLRSPVTQTRADGSKSRDPSWTTSKSGTRLAEIEGGWVYRKGMVGLDALQVVALEEHLIGDVTEYPSGETFWKAVDALRERGAHIPEVEPGARKGDFGRPDPRDVDVVLEPKRAWKAAESVTAGELESDALEGDGNGAVCCPECSEPVDAVRAVAVFEGLVDGCEEPLTDAYAEAYRLTREEYGAPLPRYLTTQDAIAEGELAIGAVRELDFWHLNADAFTADVTAEGDDVDGEPELSLDPTPCEGWRDSESGESVVVYPSGAVYDADARPDADEDDRGMALDALRFVALDSGVIEAPTDTLSGGDFTTAYRLARERYGAPLPKWYAAERPGDEPDHVPMLPSPEELLGADAAALEGDDDELETVRKDVEALVREAADPDEGDETPTVVSALPATGKTTAAIKQARDQPTTYLAPRKDLQKQALEKAERHGVGADVLPVLGGNEYADAAVEAAVEHVREHGKDTLRDRWAVLAAVDGELHAEGDGEDDETDLPRATCATADGEHGDAWALVVLVARALGYHPREIHTNGGALFGAAPPCTDGDGCPYSQAWDEINGREAPADLLVGSYAHAHVEGARTYRGLTASGDPQDEARALVVDEFPGTGYVERFGSEAFGFATWLASALVEDVEAQTDLETLALERSGEATLLGAWLDGNADAVDENVAAAAGGLERRRQLLKAVEAADRIREKVPKDDLADLGLENALSQLVEAWDDGDVEAVRAAKSPIDVAVGEPDPRENGLLSWAREAVLTPLREAGDGPIAADTETLPFPDDGELEDLLTTAVDMSTEREEGALEALKAARNALLGGEDGARALALWADDGHAHPDASHILRGVLADRDDEGVKRIHTRAVGFGEQEGTVLKWVDGDPTVLVDENREGVEILDPPARDTPAGAAPLVGLDATARPELWRVAVGERVETADVHDSLRERARFLRDVLGLSVVKMSDRARPYEGDPTTKDTDGDVALLEAIEEELGGTHVDENGQPVHVGDPAVVTSKGVEEVLKGDERLENSVGAWAHYGDLDGRNDLGEHSLAAILGSPHYGDQYVERFAALAGEQPETDRAAAGRGMALDYGSPVANAALKSMREDRVTQAILRFARGEDDEHGAVVYARTAALRDDLPVRGEGAVAKTYSRNATHVARAARALGGDFTRADVEAQLETWLEADAPSSRTIRRHLAELASAGYLERREGGRAPRYDHVETPGSGEVNLPGAVSSPPGQTPYELHYTPSVRVVGVDDLLERRSAGVSADLPAPEAARAEETVDPPG